MQNMSLEEKYFKVKILVKKSDGQDIKINHYPLPMSSMLEKISKDLVPYLKPKDIKYLITEIKRINENLKLEIKNVLLELEETELVAKRMYAPKKFNRSL
jgi:hypothetical protein